MCGCRHAGTAWCVRIRWPASRPTRHLSSPGNRRTGCSRSLSAPVGNGSGGELWINVLHRTLLQTSLDPGDSPVALARLLAQLDTISAAGIIVTTRHGADNGDPATDGIAVGSATVRFHFTPFSSPPPRDDTGAEYL